MQKQCFIWTFALFVFFALFGFAGEALFAQSEGEDAGAIPRRARGVTRTDATLMETPNAVQAVPAQILRDQQAQTLAEAARNVSSISTAQADSSGDSLNLVTKAPLPAARYSLELQHGRFQNNAAIADLSAPLLDDQALPAAELLPREFALDSRVADERYFGNRERERNEQTNSSGGWLWQTDFGDWVFRNQTRAAASTTLDPPFALTSYIPFFGDQRAQYTSGGVTGRYQLSIGDRWRFSSTPRNRLRRTFARCWLWNPRPVPGECPSTPPAPGRCMKFRAACCVGSVWASGPAMSRSVSPADAIGSRKHACRSSRPGRALATS